MLLITTDRLVSTVRLLLRPALMMLMLTSIIQVLIRQVASSLLSVKAVQPAHLIRTIKNLPISWLTIKHPTSKRMHL
jgi:hypothetical protein